MRWHSLLYQQDANANDDDDDDHDKTHAIEAGESRMAMAPHRSAIRGALVAVGAVGTLVGVALCFTGAVAHFRMGKTHDIAATEQKHVRIEGELLVITHPGLQNHLPEDREQLMAAIKDEASVSPNDVIKITKEMGTPDSASLAERVIASAFVTNSDSKDERAGTKAKESSSKSTANGLVELNGQEIVGGGSGVSLAKDTCVQWTDDPPKHKVKVCGYKFKTYWNAGCQDLMPNRPDWMTVDGCLGCTEFSTADEYNFGVVRYYDIKECP